MDKRQFLDCKKIKKGEMKIEEPFLTLQTWFFEKYKINNQPWPWNDDPKKWKELLSYTVKILILNNLKLKLK